jgi:hypothetical protein
MFGDEQSQLALFRAARDKLRERLRAFAIAEIDQD